MTKVAVVALTLAGMLGAASAASAECAWVLWSMTSSEPKGETWGVVAAFSPASGGEQACWREQKRVVQNYRNKGLEQYAHTCLPDTLDPRGPKRGK